MRGYYVREPEWSEEWEEVDAHCAGDAAEVWVALNDSEGDYAFARHGGRVQVKDRVGHVSEWWVEGEQSIVYNARPTL